MQETGNLSRDRAMVHLDGEEWSETEMFIGDRKGEMDPFMGQGEDLRHGIEQAGLVYIETAVMGCAHHLTQVRHMRRVC